MNPEMAQTISETLDMLAEKLGPAAEQVMAVAMKHSIAVGIGDFIVAGVLLLAAVVLGRVACTSREEGLDMPSLGAVFSGVGAFLCAGVVVCLGYDAFMRLYIPEWYAVADMLQYIQ